MNCTRDSCTYARKHVPFLAALDFPERVAADLDVVIRLLVDEKTAMAIGRGGGQQLLVRSLPAPLRFHVTCGNPATVDTGFVSVLGMPGRSEIRVYFVTAHAGCRNS